VEQPRNILIVDDDWQVREVLHEIFLSAGYTCQVAGDGREGLELFRATMPPLTVTDLKMPVMDGIALLQGIRNADNDAAVIVLTGAADVKTAIESLKLGAHDFIMKPVNVDELLIAAERALERRQLLIERREYQALLERRVEEATKNLADAYTQTLEALGAALDSRDVGTESHSRRVHGYSLALAREHGVKPEDLPDLAHGVLLHDIGKIGIPDAILLKPGPLTPDEWKVMRSHPEIGKRLIEKIPFLHNAIPVVWCHHEKWDGSGYPRGLKGEQIPLNARIFCVVDAFDAMTFDRPYSKAIPSDAAIAEIKRCAGAHFDPSVVESFLRVPIKLLDEIRRKSVE
jgi:response regulator RpfG family c-di-GMP phosphodiesterase